MADGRGQRDWVVVLTAPRIDGAYHAVGVLEGVGIRAEVWPGPPPGWRQTTQQGRDLWGDHHSAGPHRVAVAPDNAARARELLRTHTMPTPPTPS